MTSEEQRKGGRGRKVYQTDKGAPLLQTRVDPEVLSWLKARPEGVRSWIENLVREYARRESVETSPNAESPPAEPEGEN